MVQIGFQLKKEILGDSFGRMEDGIRLAHEIEAAVCQVRGSDDADLPIDDHDL